MGGRAELGRSLLVGGHSSSVEEPGRGVAGSWSRNGKKKRGAGCRLVPSLRAWEPGDGRTNRLLPNNTSK